MNAMGHDVPTMIGVDQRGIAEKIAKLVPDYMAMGERGGSMGDMEMPLPDNTLPMMTGAGPVRRHRNGRHVHHRQDPQGTSRTTITTTPAGTSSRPARRV